MRARLPRQIDQLGGFADAAHGRFAHRLGFADQRDHAAIVIRVAFAAQQIHAGNRPHGVHDGVYFATWRPSEKFGTHSTSCFIG